jgi:hypothetical protein
MERYTAMYHHGQPGLPDDPVIAYVNGLRAAGAAPGSTTTRRARPVQWHDLSDGEIWIAHGGVNPCDLVVRRGDRELRTRWLC